MAVILLKFRLERGLSYCGRVDLYCVWYTIYLQTDFLQADSSHRTLPNRNITQSYKKLYSGQELQ